MIEVTKPYLQMQSISKQFSGVSVLNKVDLFVREGETLALMGANGAGKSTLMNILGGVLQPDDGQILIDQEPRTIRNSFDAEQYGIGFIHQDLALCGSMSVAENIFIYDYPLKNGLIDKKTIEEQSRGILQKLRCNIDVREKIDKLSAGDRQLVEIARVLISDAKILIFDEPTSSLSIQEKLRFFEIIESLKKDGKVIIYITHFLDEIFTICDRVQVLRNGEMSGEGKIDDLVHDDIVHMMVGKIDIKSISKGDKSGSEVVMSVSGLNRTDVLSSISFDLHRGEILGLWGLMGSGRTELARAILGLDKVHAGQIMIRENGKLKKIHHRKIHKWIGLVTENRRDDGLFLPLSVKENIASASILSLIKRNGMTIDNRRESRIADEQIDQLEIKVNSKDQIVGTLSGGNQQKTVLGRWLSKAPPILILDEPTRGVDVRAKSEIHKLIRNVSEEGYSVIVISSEIEEIMDLCDRYLVIRDGEIVTELACDASEKDLMLWAANRTEKGE